MGSLFPADSFNMGNIIEVSEEELETRKPYWPDTVPARLLSLPHGISKAVPLISFRRSANSRGHGRAHEVRRIMDGDSVYFCVGDGVERQIRSAFLGHGVCVKKS